jgi:hypothetical protein
MARNPEVTGRVISLLVDGVPLTPNLGSLNLTGHREVSAIGDDVTDNVLGGGYWYVWSGETNNADETEIFIDGILNSRLKIPAEEEWGFQIEITAGDGTDGKSWRITGTIKRDGAGNTTLSGQVKKTSFGEDDGADTWNAQVEADDTNEALIIKITGQVAKTIKWRAGGNFNMISHA